MLIGTVLADDSLAAVLELVRTGTAVTRPELVRFTGLGRHVVAQRAAQLIDIGLLTEDAFGRSTGGRAPRELRFAAEAGCILVAQLGARHLDVAVTDLDGEILAQHHQAFDVADGPDAVLEQVRGHLDALRAGVPSPVWGIGLGLPGPVEFSTGRVVSPPIMPGWNEYPVREYFTERYGVPVWVDNDVNTMALGELRAGVGRGIENLVFVKVGTGIGAGLVSNGLLHRGAQGAAGDIGHISIVGGDDAVLCRCGRRGCLEAVAGGAALARDGIRAAQDATSAYLQGVLLEGHLVDTEHVIAGAARGDAACTALLLRSGDVVGDALSRVVNVFNPSVVVLGGSVVQSGESYVAVVRARVYAHSLPLATRDLSIVLSPLGDGAGMRGAAHMVLDELFSQRHLRVWVADGHPVGHLELVDG